MPNVKQLAKDAVLRLFAIRRRLADENAVLLTFDDGPHPEVTPAVLERLARYGAKGVFFVVGNRVPKAPHMLRAILDGGHILGNHTFEHPLDREMGLWSYVRDLRQCQRTLTALTGTTPRWFRPPLGRLSLGSLVAPKLVGLRTLLWSRDIDDWRLRDTQAAEATGRRLADETRSGDVILLHDDNPCVLAVLDAALPRLAERGVNMNCGVE